MRTKFFDSIIIFIKEIKIKWFGKTKATKEKFYGAKNVDNIVILKLVENEK